MYMLKAYKKKHLNLPYVVQKVSCHQCTEDQVPTVGLRCHETRVHHFHFRLSRDTCFHQIGPGHPIGIQPHPQMSTETKCFLRPEYFVHIYRVYRAKIKTFLLLRMWKSTINLNAFENKCVIDKDIFLFFVSLLTECIKGSKQQASFE